MVSGARYVKLLLRNNSCAAVVTLLQNLLNKKMSKFEILGFTDMDGFVATCCLMAGAFGALVDYILKRENLVKFTAEAQKLKFMRWMPLMFARLMIGVASGGFVWLLLSGGMLQNRENFCRLIILAIASGFSSPAVLTKYRAQIGERISRVLLEKR